MESEMKQVIGSDIAEPAKKKRGKIVFFGEAEAPLVQETNVMENVFSPRVGAALSKMVDEGYGEGHVLKCLFESPEPDGFSLTYVWFKSEFPLPPHRHNTDCLYYLISGEIKMGNRVLRAGEGFFLPADAGYSYTPGEEGVELLEFRGSTRFNIEIPDGSPEMWDRFAKTCAKNRDLWKTQRPPIRKGPAHETTEHEVAGLSAAINVGADK
jgi:hypothetical protein